LRRFIPAEGDPDGMQLDAIRKTQLRSAGKPPHIFNCLREAVAPGSISSEMVQASLQEPLDKVIATIPVGRLGEPDQVAHVVEFLADQASAYITGQVYSVNGGQYR